MFGKKKLFLMVAIFCSMNVFAEQQLKILSWMRLDRDPQAQDLAAEVCFALTPAPAQLTPITVTVDSGTQSESYYNTFVDKRGSACLVVSTFRGSVEVGMGELTATTKSLPAR